ncbi:MAG: hypothetical protein ACPF8Z_06710, partial [Schleiferiaceae bacterium]
EERGSFDISIWPDTLNVKDSAIIKSDSLIKGLVWSYNIKKPTLGWQGGSFLKLINHSRVSSLNCAIHSKQ